MHLFHCLRAESRAAQPGRSRRCSLARAPCETAQAMGAPRSSRQNQQPRPESAAQDWGAKMQMPDFWLDIGVCGKSLSVCFPCVLPQAAMAQRGACRGVMCTALLQLLTCTLVRSHPQAALHLSSLKSVKSIILDGKRSPSVKS